MRADHPAKPAVLDWHNVTGIGMMPRYAKTCKECGRKVRYLPGRGEFQHSGGGRKAGHTGSQFMAYRDSKGITWQLTHVPDSHPWVYEVAAYGMEPLGIVTRDTIYTWMARRGPSHTHGFKTRFDALCWLIGTDLLTPIRKGGPCQ